MAAHCLCSTKFVANVFVYGLEVNEGAVMDMIQVVSTAILAVGYDPATQRMKITFVEGHTYDFCRVPEQIFRGLLYAGSKGRYYNDHIKDRYRC